MNTKLLGWGLLALVIVYVITAYNRLVTLHNQVKNAWAQIDVQLKRRHDLIPNLVETVKDSMSFDQETLQKVIEARGKAVSAQTPGESIQAEGILGQAMGKLFAVMEAYPTLKSQENVARLMEELSTTENQIGFARQAYNDGVMFFNTATQSFPANIVAGIFRFTQEPFFAVPEEEKAVPKVDLK